MLGPFEEDEGVPMQIEELLEERILILDGALGTMIQSRQLVEEDFRGERFREIMRS